MIKINRKTVKAALIRAAYTMIQTAAATVGAESVLSEINWPSLAVATFLSGVLSLIKSLSVGMPEVTEADADAEYDERGEA